MLSAPISELFPNLFSTTRPMTTPDVPVIVAASILAAYEAPIIPMSKVEKANGAEKRGVKLFKAIGGRQIISLIVKSEPRDYYRLMWEPCTSTTTWLGALEYQDSLNKLLKTFSITGFGDARVNAPSPPHALVTLDEVVSLYRDRGLRCTLRAHDIASEAISIDPETSLLEAMRTMCDNRVRRLFLKGKKGEFISDRSVLAFLFSPRGITIAKEAPRSWTNAKVRKVPGARARGVAPDLTAEDIGKMVEPGHDVFVLSDGASLISKWDLVMKPWEAEKLWMSA